MTTTAFLFFYASLYDEPPRIKTFLDREGRVIGSLHSPFEGLQHWVPYTQIPQSLIEETLRREDRFFYWHHGVNPLSLLKAFFDNLSHFSIQRGGSTITQQLAKNLLLEKEKQSSPRTYFRKLQEIFLALGLELKHSKQWILERYLNSIYYGNRCYGIGAATLSYFSKTPQELNPFEIKLLSSLPRAPSLLAKNLPHPKNSLSARHFIEWASSQTKLSHIHTTLDLEMQKKIEKALQTSLAERSQKDPKITAAAVVIDVRTGDIWAMVGSRDYLNEDIQGTVNGATALRQPGSTLKPFTYFAAFTQGVAPDTTLADQPTSFHIPSSPEEAENRIDSYQPQNFDRRFHGTVTVREALANSYNVPAVVMLNQVGLSYYHDMLKRFGFTSFDKSPTYYGLAITLGSAEVSLLELTTAYAALARGGKFLPYRFLSQTPQALPVWIHPKAALSAMETTSILIDGSARLKAFGYNDDMHIDDHEVAVKTGTSYEHRDNWTIGYTPQVAVGVWVGHADGTPLSLTTGASGAAPVWHSIMESVLRGTPSLSFPKPPVTKSAPMAEISSKPWKVTFPLPYAHYRLHDYLPTEHQSLVMEAKAWQPVDLEWYLDGVFLGETKKDHRLWLQPTPGKHVLNVKNPLTLETEHIPFFISGDL